MLGHEREHGPSGRSFLPPLLQDGWTASHWAAQKGHLEALRTLLAAGANPAAASKVRCVTKHYGPPWDLRMGVSVGREAAAREARGRCGCAACR